MKSIFTLSLALAMFLGTENVQAIRIQSEVRFVDDVIRMLDESNKKDEEDEKAEAAAAKKPSGLTQCNPCPNSSAGVNANWEAPGNAKARELEKKNAEEAKKAAEAAAAPPADKKASLAECNPCPNSSTGVNPHNPAAKPDPVDDKKKALSQASAKPAMNSAIVDDSIPLDSDAVGQYASVIADAAEESEPEQPVVYTETITE